MNTMKQYETLDEAIDRLAAAMTVVPADEYFSTRLAARLDDSTNAAWPWSSYAFGRAVLAVAVVSALALAIRISVAPEPVAPRPLLTAQNISLVAPRAGAVMAMVPHVPSATFESAVARLEPAPTIPALPTPAQIDLGTLELQSLNIAPVELDLLELANLAVGEIGGAIDFKEP